MENQFKKLSMSEKKLLLKAPALMSIIAAGTDQKVDQKEREEAIQLAHLRTFNSIPLLQPYYKEVELVFEKNLEELLLKYEPLDEAQQNQMKIELKTIYDILSKLENNFQNEFKSSLKSFGEHVSNVHFKFSDFFDFSIFHK
jgi:hypothetical protein